jgi:tetratricopeptide (TPR) repeat protein
MNHATFLMPAGTNRCESPGVRSKALHFEWRVGAAGPAGPRNNDFYLGELSQVYSALAQHLKPGRQNKQAEEAYRQAIHVCQERVAKFPTRDNELALAWTYADLGNLCRDAQRTKEAEQAYRDALDQYAKLLGHTPADGDAAWRSANVSLDLGNLLRTNHESAKADQVCREAVQVCRNALAQSRRSVAGKNHGEDRRDFGICYEALGHVLKELNQTQEAEEAYRDALSVWDKRVASFHGEDDRWHLAVSGECLGNLLRAAGQLEKAAEAYRGALTIIALDSAAICSAARFSSSSRSSNAFVSGSDTDNASLVKPMP